jgi:hypothetical protein
MGNGMMGLKSGFSKVPFLSDDLERCDGFGR